MSSLSTPRPVPLSQAHRLLNHGPTVLVSSAHGDRRNIMAAAWSMPLDFDPPKVAVVLDKATLTRELVDASGEFVLAVPCRAIAEQTLAAGTLNGRDGDKFAALEFETFPASRVGAPLPAGCIAWLECRVIDEPQIQHTYDLFLGEVVAAWADPAEYSDGRWHFSADERRSLHYVAGGQFFVTGDALEVSTTG